MLLGLTAAPPHKLRSSLWASVQESGEGDKDSARWKGSVGGWVQPNWLQVLPLGTLRGEASLAPLKVWSPLSLLLPSRQLSEQGWPTRWEKLVSPTVAEGPGEMLGGSFPRGRGVGQVSLQADIKQTGPFPGVPGSSWA